MAEAVASEGSSIRTMLLDKLSIFRSWMWMKSSPSTAGLEDSIGCASIAGDCTRRQLGKVLVENWGRVTVWERGIFVVSEGLGR